MNINKLLIFVILSLPVFTFSPWMYPADFPKTIIFRSVLAMLGFLFLYNFFHKKNKPQLPNLKNNRVAWALAGLLGVFLLASLFSIDAYFSFWGSPWRGGGFVTFTFYFVFAIFAFKTFDKQSWQKTWDFSIFVGVLVSLVAICQYFSLFSKILVPVPGRPASTTGNPILLAIYLLLLFFLTLTFFIKNKVVWQKVLYGIAVLIFAFTIFISGTRAVWGGLIVGLLYFLLFYHQNSAQGSKKAFGKDFLSLSKIIAGLFVIAVVIVVAYVNLFPSKPEALPKNRVLQTLESRLSIKSALNDERFLGWQVAVKAIGQKPILGWGPENFAVGFDKNYDPKIISSFWWDKAHNVVLDMGVQTGILGILAYLTLFVVLFWQLHKLKRTDLHGLEADLHRYDLISHGVQTTLIGYFVANLFSFDSFTTYLIFFLLIGYSLHLTSIRENPLSSTSIQNKNISGKKVALSLSFVVLLFFLWQYNLKPFIINAQINKAQDLVTRKYCGQGLDLLEKNLTQKSFLDSYFRMEYVEMTKTCNNFFPENNLTYTKRGAELIKEAVKIQPTYTRYWLYLGSANNALAVAEKDTAAKKDLLDQANVYLEKALQLALKHQEIFVEQAKVSITLQDYQGAKNYAEKCIALNENYANCYFYLGLSEIYLKDSIQAQKDLQTAKNKGYGVYSKISLGELSDAYGSIPDYKNLVEVYKNLILYVNSSFAQYHSSLAFFYRELGQYKEARAEAIRTLELSPESKDNVKQFLKTLP